MYSVQVAVSDGTLTSINLSIEYFAREDITLYRNQEIVPLVLGTDWQWDTDAKITLLTGTPVPAGQSITVRRNTNKERAYNIYDGGAAFSRETLDENFRQMIYLAQEFTEGNGLTGLFFPLDMHGFQITNLGDGTLDKDAVNKGQLDSVGDRVSAIENSFVTDTVSYPWYEETTVSKDTFTPPFAFTKAAVFINGVCQTPDYSYIVVDNTIVLAEPVPAGTMFFARLGEDIGLDPDYATAEQLGVVASEKASKGANSDITSLSGLSTPLSVSQGGTGNAVGRAASATKLDVPRGMVVDLASVATVNFDGTSDVNLGIKNTLPVSHGGTGATTAALARSNINAAVVGDNSDITKLSGLSGGIQGVTTGVDATSGIVGEQRSEVTSSPVTLTSGVAANIVSLTLPIGDWEINCNIQLINSNTVTARTFGVSTTSGAVPSNWYERYSTTANLTSGTTNIAGITYRLVTSAVTTLYLVANITFTGTCTAHGHIRTRRMR